MDPVFTDEQRDPEARLSGRVHGLGEPQDLAMDEALLRDLIRRARRGEDAPEGGSDDDEA